MARMEATVFDIVSNPGAEDRGVGSGPDPQGPRRRGPGVHQHQLRHGGGLRARDAVFLERADSPWVNILAVKAGRENDPALLDLVEAYQSEAVVRYVESKYPGSLVPGF